MTAFPLTLNGCARTVPKADADSILLDWLRAQDGLRGTKEGCAEGDCGTCSVLVSPPSGGIPRPANSCLLKTGQVAGLSVTTVEGLGTRHDPHPLQSAIAASGGTQCGYCTPGFVVAGAALLARDSDPDENAIHDAFSGNLCRCTGYRAIVSAVHAAAPARPRLEDAPPAAAPKDLVKVLLPESTAEALEMAAIRSESRFLAGGTDLLLEREVRKTNGCALILLSRIPEIARIVRENNHLVLGGACPIEDLLPAVESRWPSFGRILRRFGSVQIRSQATLGGNLATASPIGDAAPCLIALDARIRAHGPDGEREIAAEKLITGYRKTCLRANEIIASIRVPESAPNSEFRAWKVSKRYDQDISTLSAAFRIDRDGKGRVIQSRVVFGGMADRPLRCPPAEDALRNLNFEGAAASISEFFSPIDDLRGSARYRQLAAAGLVERLALDLSGEKALEVMDL